MFLFYVSLSAQEIRVTFKEKPLGEVLTYIRDNSTVSVSFDPVELNKYSITADTLFSDPRSAIIHLTAEFPLIVTEIDSVLVIYGKEEKGHVYGTVSDKTTGERLPNTAILTGGRRFFSDINGYFNILPYRDDSNTPAKTTFYYLGYKVLDTLLPGGGPHSVKMDQIDLRLKEILIKGFRNGNALQTGERSGILRINPAIAHYLPGNGDNSVFNLLRLMPGVRAAGEPSGFSVWNSKPGESSVIFDEAKLYAMNGYNEQISAVNPFMVNEIKVYKGGYGPEFGNQAGAIAQITGIGGNKNKPELKLNINNLTANVFGSLPFSNNSVLAASYRQTYYELYNVNTLNPFGNRGNSAAAAENGNSSAGAGNGNFPVGSGNSSSWAGTGNGNPQNSNNREPIYITPDYRFRDANIRYSGDLKRGGRFFASFSAASDKFTYSLENEDNDIEASENNNQITFSAGIYIPSKRGSVTSISGNISMLDKSSDKIVRLKKQSSLFSIQTENSVEDGGLKVARSFGLFRGGNLDAGVEANYLSAYEDNSNPEQSGRIKSSLFLNGKISLKGANISAGARGDLYRGNFYFQPRLSASYNFSDNFSVSGAWGIYNQFLGKVPVIYENVAPVMVWRILGEDGHPVTKSMHAIAGTSWSSRTLTFSLEGFHKRTEGISQVIITNSTPSVKNGFSEITGTDLFVKWESRGNQIFTSITAARATESYSDTREYKYNPLEVKSGLIINLTPVWLSASYVYGDGYLNAYGTGKYSDLGSSRYSRLDISATYNFKIGKAAFRTGISILNLLNTENRKTLEVLTIPSEGGQSSSLQNLYSESIPFTPTLYLEISF
ncbi:MAG: TonB-dependent receptor [Bacteroidales bacterium]|nr:TonB-dependent receptor [Bacteroidales bacterium]MDD3989411.1 TonB-dependent receptor [Bacteroidales bacterium]